MKKVTMLLLVVVLFAAGSVLAQNRGHKSFRGKSNTPKQHKKMHRTDSPFGNLSLTDISLARADLNLTDEQAEKLEKLHYEFTVAQVDRRAGVSKARIELGRLKKDKSASEQSVMQAIDKMAQAKAELEKAQYQYTSDMKSVLNEEQLKKWQEIRKNNRRDLNRHLRHRWPGGLGQMNDDDWDDHDEDSDEDDDDDDD